jgi:DegV family protein with EDD domain
MIRIITDSTCEMPEEVMNHPAVSVVPLYVLFGQEVLRDGVDITREQFWARLPKADPLPTTSQATPADFLEPFRRYTDAGDEIITIVISSKLSGTYASALQALDELPGRPIEVIDSLSTSVGLGLMVQEALTMAEAGATRAEIVARLNAMREQVHILFVVETLEYLQRGGRIGKAQAFVGTLLKFKPLLGIVGGEVVPVARVRSTRKAQDTMLELLAQQVPARGPEVRLAVTHAMIPDDAARIGQELTALFGSTRLFISSLGPVLGTHVGPGTIGAAVCAGG